jgi:hypothetical protein
LTTVDKSEKVVFVFLNVALAAVWVRFLIRLIARWSLMEPSFRVPVSLFLLFFSLWWISSIRENRRAIPFLMAGGVFMTVYEIVRTF